MTAARSPKTDKAWVTTKVGDLGRLYCGQSPAAVTVNGQGEGTLYVSGPEQWDGNSIHQNKWTTAATRTAPARSIFITVKDADVGTLFPGIDAAIGRDIYAFEPHESIDFRFVHRALQYSIQDVIARARGDIPGLSKNHILDHLISVPGISTQRRVASKIDELYSRVDEGERALERVQKLVERYRQSILKAAVTGELTREWRGQRKGKLESGKALLQRILKARRETWQEAELEKMRAKGIKPEHANWKAKYREPTSPDIAALPELPDGWVWASVGQLCFIDTGATPRRGEPKYYEGGTIPWITSAAVNEATITRRAEMITQRALDETNAKIFPSGTLIVAMYGEGRTRGKISELRIDAATNQACAALLCAHLDDEVKTYLRTFFEKNYVALRSEAAGGVQPNLNLSILKGIALPMPPIEEMAMINRQVAERASHIAAMISDFGAWNKLSAALRQSVLREAFRGGLCHQDPADQPAAILLERIGAERSQSSAPRRGRQARSDKP